MKLALFFIFLLLIQPNQLYISPKILFDDRTNNYIIEYEIPTKNAGLGGLTVDENNNVWFVEINKSKIGVLFNNFTIKEYQFKINRTAKSGIEYIAISQIKYDKLRNSLWFTWSPSDALIKFNLNSLNFEIYKIDEKDSGVFDVFIDGKGNIWATLLFSNKIIKLEPENNKIEKFLIPDPLGGPAILTEDKYGNIWVTLAYGRKLAKLNVEKLEANTSKGIDLFENFDFKNVFYSPVGIFYDNKRNLLWIADHGSSSIYSFNPFNLTWKQYLVYQSGDLYSLINYVKMDSKGRIWFASHIGNTVGFLNPEKGYVIEFKIPTFNSTTLWLEIDKNDNVWFTEFLGNKIGLIKSFGEKYEILSNINKININSGQTGEFEIEIEILIEKEINATLNYSSIYLTLKNKIEIIPEKGNILLKNGTKIKVKIKYYDLPQGNYVFLVVFKSPKMIISINIYLLVNPKGFEWFSIILAIVIPLMITIFIFIFLRKFFYKK
jgi:Streptogramin lyase